MNGMRYKGVEYINVEQSLLVRRAINDPLCMKAAYCLANSFLEDSIVIIESVDSNVGIARTRNI